MSRTVSLPMYDFAEVQDSTTVLLEAIVRGVRELGDKVVVGIPDSSEHRHLMSYWLGTQMYMSQSCGLPYVEELSNVVDVLGTFIWNGISDEWGNYRTHILVRGDHSATMVSELRGARPVISNAQSLSGWCSLGCALAEVTADPGFVQPYLIGHHHAGSLQLLQDGIADVASIDPATLQLLRRHRPSLVHGLRDIGSGPLIPATPVIVNKARTATMEDLRELLRRIVKTESLSTAMSEIGIVGVVYRDPIDYEMIRALVASSERVLPRRE